MLVKIAKESKMIETVNDSKILTGDAVEKLRSFNDDYFDCCVTSPPYYGLRDYGKEEQIGLETTPEDYIDRLVEVFREVKRVLKEDGTLWLIIGDSYAGSGKGVWNKPINERPVDKQAYLVKEGANPPKANKPTGTLKPKDMIGIPWMLAFALRNDGWYLRQDIIWSKTNPMPESVRDRCTKSHEYIFLLSKSSRYYYDAEAICEPCAESTVKRLNQNVAVQTGSLRAYGKTNGSMKAVAPRFGGKKYSETPDKFFRTKSGSIYQYKPRRNKRDVWAVSTKPTKLKHFAVFPPDLILPCVLAGSRENGIVLDPFCGSGTTGVVAIQNGRKFVGIDINEEYSEMAEQRIANERYKAQKKSYIE